MIHTLRTNLPSEQGLFSALEKQPGFVVLTVFFSSTQKEKSLKECLY